MALIQEDSSAERQTCSWKESTSTLTRLLVRIMDKFGEH